METENEALLNLIQSRRSIRDYLPQPVEMEKITRLLELAMSAPSASNSQPWEFVVVTEADLMQKLREKLMFARYDAPAAIVVCGNLKIAYNSAARHYWVQDCSAAMENMLVAAPALGLGAVWIGVYPLPSVIRVVSEALNLPEHVVPLGLMYVGYPNESKPPRTQYEERRVHWQQYQLRKQRAKLKNTKYNAS
jgi:nitroreductase